MGKVTVKIPHRTVKPKDKPPTVKPPPEEMTAKQTQMDQAHAEQVQAERVPLKKRSVDMASLFSGPFFGGVSPSTAGSKISPHNRPLGTVSPSNGSLDLKTSASSEGYPKYPYSIQLGSFRTLDRAKKAVDAYRKKGLHAYWSEADREGNERWFRVYSGSFESREKARMYKKEQSLDRSLVKKTPYSAFVGTYTDRRVLEDQTLLLESLDYVPYAIEEEDGRYRLFVGAFLSKKIALEKQLDLESRGIQCQVVKR
jgi:cell division septation protein DedD